VTTDPLGDLRSLLLRPGAFHPKPSIP